MLPKLGRKMMARKRQKCREIDTRCGRRLASLLCPSRGPLRFVTILPPFALAFVLERSTKNEAFEETVLSLFPFLPHLFLRQIRRLKVQNMTCNHILIIRYPLSKLTAGPKIESRGNPQVTVWGIEMLFSTIHCRYLSDALLFNPFTAKVLHGVL